ncbi:MAG: sigma-70 family RNA polymerase sigma factor [Acidobacteria bacterium]|nr:sigma-70 family RNA polymerase sigma factor [Acidobacteriota bacterium]
MEAAIGAGEDRLMSLDPGTEEAARELVLRARTGDAEAFDQLMVLHQRRVLNTAWRLLGQLEDAKDAAQEVFLRLYRFLPRLDGDRDLRPWLYRVTINVCRDAERRRRSGGTVSLGAEMERCSALFSSLRDAHAVLRSLGSETLRPEEYSAVRRAVRDRIRDDAAPAGPWYRFP